MIRWLRKDIMQTNVESSSIRESERVYSTYKRVLSLLMESGVLRRDFCGVLCCMKATL